VCVEVLLQALHEAGAAGLAGGWHGVSALCCRIRALFLYAICAAEALLSSQIEGTSPRSLTS